MDLVTKAGEALALLSLENKQNCQRMMSLKLSSYPHFIASLISVLEDPVHGFPVARILRNLCAYAEADFVEPREIAATTAQVEECIHFITFRFKIAVRFEDNFCRSINFL